MDADGLATDFCRLLHILCCSHQQHQPTYAQQQHVQTLLVCLQTPTANRHSKLSRLLADSAVPLGTVRQDVGNPKSQTAFDPSLFSRVVCMLAFYAAVRRL
jgi:hypothetical protein